MHHKSIKLLIIIILSFINAECYSQTINKYIILYKNRKNDSIIKPSPLASGYEKNTAIEFSFEPEPTEAMKRRIKHIFGDQLNQENQQNIDDEQNNYDIFGNNDQLLKEETNTLLQELAEESLTAIARQEKKAQEKLEAQRKENIALYAASVEAKIKRDREAALNPVKNEEPVWNEFQDSYSDPTDEEVEENSEDSIILVTDSNGRINRVKKQQKESIASTTTVLNASDSTPLANK